MDTILTRPAEERAQIRARLLLKMEKDVLNGPNGQRKPAKDPVTVHKVLHEAVQLSATQIMDHALSE